MKKRVAKKIVLIGVYPPPYGGVSVHVKRLYEILLEDGNNVTVLCNPSKKRINDNVDIVSVKPKLTWKNILRYHWKIIRKADVVYSHFSWSCSPIVLLASIFGKNTIITFHNQMFDFTTIRKLPLTQRYCTKIMIKLCNTKYVAVSDTIKDILITLKVDTKKIYTIPAYIPIRANEGNKSDEEVRKLIEQYVLLKDHILVVYGWRVSFIETLKEDKDLYGFNRAIKVYKKLKNRNTNIYGMIIIIPEIDGKGISYMKKLINGENILTIYKPIIEMSIVWRNCDLYLRPTLTDGDSVAVREALSANCLVVASDSTKRPAGTIEYRCGDLNSCANSIEKALDSKRCDGSDTQSNNQYRKVYGKLIE